MPVLRLLGKVDQETADNGGADLLCPVISPGQTRPDVPTRLAMYGKLCHIVRTMKANHTALRQSLCLVSEGMLTPDYAVGTGDPKDLPIAGFAKVFPKDFQTAQELLT